ncbi:hypothetical protein BT69DRAFT_1281645 [Atractiella rhizophila]|nr:hypothetical protein BT69DRAFT_1281645 [Atractiella rhizophila]
MPPRPLPAGVTPSPQSTMESGYSSTRPLGSGGEFDADLLARAPEVSNEQRQAGYDESLLHRHRTTKTEASHSHTEHSSNDYPHGGPAPPLPGMRVASPTGSNYSSAVAGVAASMPPGAAPPRHPTGMSHHPHPSRGSSTDKLAGSGDLSGHSQRGSAHLGDGRGVYSSLGGRVTPEGYAQFPASNGERVSSFSEKVPGPPKTRRPRDVDGTILESGSRRKPWFKRPLIILAIVAGLLIVAVAVAVPVAITQSKSNDNKSSTNTAGPAASSSCPQTICFATGPVASPTTNTGSPTNLQPVGASPNTSAFTPVRTL